MADEKSVPDPEQEPKPERKKPKGGKIPGAKDPRITSIVFREYIETRLKRATSSPDDPKCAISDDLIKDIIGCFNSGIFSKPVRPPGPPPTDPSKKSVGRPPKNIPVAGAEPTPAPQPDPSPLPEEMANGFASPFAGGDFTPPPIPAAAPVGTVSGIPPEAATQAPAIVRDDPGKLPAPAAPPAQGQEKVGSGNNGVRRTIAQRL